MKLQLKRSLQLSAGVAQEPSAAQLEFGEVAINYSSTDPSIFLKDQGGTIKKLQVDSVPTLTPGTTLDDRYGRLGQNNDFAAEVTATKFNGPTVIIDTQANRPATSGAGQLFYNTDSSELEISDGASFSTVSATFDLATAIGALPSLP